MIAIAKLSITACHTRASKIFHLHVSVGVKFSTTNVYDIYFMDRYTL